MNVGTQFFLAALALVGGMANASAALIDLWDYTLNTAFTGVNTFTEESGTITQDGKKLENGTQVSWGSPDPSVSVFDPPSSNVSLNRSGITLATTGKGADNPPPAADMSGTFQTDDVRSVGLGTWITHHNKPISDTYIWLMTAQIATTLTLTPNNPPRPGQQVSSTVDFTLYFAETLNKLPCTATSLKPCNDIIAVNAADVLNRSLTFEGIDYFVSTFPIVGTGLANFNPLTDAECREAGANIGCFGFTTVEGEDTDIQLGFVITSQPVPEPTTFLLACAGLGVLILARRRRV